MKVLVYGQGPADVGWATGVLERACAVISRIDSAPRLEVEVCDAPCPTDEHRSFEVCSHRDYIWIQCDRDNDRETLYRADADAMHDCQVRRLIQRTCLE